MLKYKKEQYIKRNNPIFFLICPPVGGLEFVNLPLVSISPLPLHLVHHIAAGEVIEKPSSVIKELIENALDAGATRIGIVVEKAGLQFIKVTDNGQGISHKDGEMLFTRYATSKVKQLDDLVQLKTHGFRGEALFSIMSVADVEVLTKRTKEKNGSRIQTEHGMVKSITPIGHRTGTTVNIRNLFQRFPVRRKTIHIGKEKKDIRKIVESYALIYPQHAFSLRQDGTLIFSSYEHQSDQERLELFWGIAPNSLLCIEQMTIYGRILGWITTPENFASHNRHQLLSVNKRAIVSPELSRAVETGLHTFRHAGKYPQYAIHLELNPHIVDANIHPQKTQIRLLHLDEVMQELTQAVSKTLARAETKELTYTGQSVFPILQHAPVSEKQQSEFQILGDVLQLENTFLLVLTNQGVLLVDQHSADERLWYNRLLKEKKLLKKIEAHLSEACQNELDDDLYQHSFDDQINGKIATIACHAAIRAGQKLSQIDAKNLIEKLLAGGNQTLTCPHGRPTYIHVSSQQLAQLFRRS